MRGFLRTYQEIEVAKKAIREANRPERATKAKAVKSGKYPVDVFLVLTYKSLHGMSWLLE